MPEYTTFNQTKPCNKDVLAGNSERSPDVKAGFLDGPARPVGFQGRDFLSSNPVTSGKAETSTPAVEHRGALTREDVRPLAGVHGLCGDPRKTSWRDDSGSSEK